MKKYLASLLLISIALIALADSTPVEKNPGSTTDVQALKKQVTELQARVQKLEDQTRTLESTVANLQKQRLVPLLEQPRQPFSPTLPPPGSPPPKIWGKKQVNGWTFYIVPCEQGQ